MPAALVRYSDAPPGARTAEKRTAPGALRPEPLRCPGQLNGTNHPPMVDLLALASRSTSHRPSCPKAGGRCRVVGPVPGCPARCRHDVEPLPRASPGHRSGAVRTAPTLRQLGWLTLASARATPLRPPGEPAGHPRWLGGIRPCTVSADADLAEAWVRTVFRPPPPEGDLRQTRLPGPGRRCAVRYGAHIATPHHPRSRGISQYTGFSPELSRYAQETCCSSTVHAQRYPQCSSAGLTASGSAPSSASARTRDVAAERVRSGS